MDVLKNSIGYVLPGSGNRLTYLSLLLAGIFSAILFALAPTPASALTTVPTKMNFQGRLTDTAGNVKANGTYNMRLKLYTVDTGGSAVWSEDRLVSASQGVTVTNGTFSIQLGSLTALPASLFASGALYLEVELPTPATATSSSPTWTEGPMTPRNQMATSAYAYNAETLDGLDSADFGQVSANNIWSGTNTFNVLGANAFSIQNGSAVDIFKVDTTNQRVSVGGSTSTARFGVEGAGGSLWTARTAAEANSWKSITYGNGLFVAVAYDGTNRVMTSPDGITWTTRTAAEANGWQSVLFGGGQFVAVANSGTNRVMTSPDGITWTARTAAEANPWKTVTYGNGLYVAVSAYGTNDVMTSPDGITWTSRTPAEGIGWASVAYGNGMFVAVGDGGSNRVMTSPDGITWTSRTAAEMNPWNSVTYGGGQFVAVSTSGTNRVMTSLDGITWTARSAVASSWYTVTYGNGLYVAVAGSGTDRVMTSPDGITWTPRTQAETNTWNSVTYGNNMFVAVAEGGTNRVMTSSDIALSARGAAQITGSLSVTGDIRATTTSTSAFSIQNASGVEVFNIDTSTQTVSVADVAPLTAAIVGSNVITNVASSASDISSTLGSDGFARISYYDASSQDLKFVQCTDTDCTTKNITTVDGTGVVGFSSDIALGSDSFARISYYDATNGDLKFAQCTNADCTTRNITTVDSTNNVGSYTSIAMGSDGFARISYSNNFAGDLKFVQCTNADCTTRNITTVDSANVVGQNTSLVLGSDGFARITHNDNTNSKLRFVQCTNDACSTNTQTVIADSTSSSAVASIALGSDGLPRIAYRYYSNPINEFRFVQCTNAACSTNNNTLLTQNDQPYSVSVVVGSDGYARIAYGSNTQSDLRYIHCTDAQCSTKTDTAIDTYGSKGASATISLGSDGYARIVYQGSEAPFTTNNILFARLTSHGGTEIRAGVNLGSSATDAFAEIYAKRVEVEGSVTIDATNRSKFGAAVTIIGPDTYIDARGVTGSSSKFSVTKDTFTFTDSLGQNGFSGGAGGFHITNNSGSSNSLFVYQSGTGNGIVSTVMPSASSALLLNNEDTGTELLKINAEGKTTFITESVDSKAFSFGTYGGVSLFEIDTSNSRVQIGEAAADGNGVVLVLDNKNTAGDPVGTNGAMYYNANAEKFRCYQGGVWTDCISGQYINLTMLSSTHIDGQDTYFGNAAVGSATVGGQRRIYFPKAGTIKSTKIWTYSSSAGSGEAWSMYVTKNNTTDTFISTVSSSTSERVWDNNSLSISIAAGDYIEIKSVNPTWATNPGGVVYSGYIYFE